MITLDERCSLKLHAVTPSYSWRDGSKLVSGTLLISSRGIALIASVTSLSIGRSECTGAILTSKAALSYQAVGMCADSQFQERLCLSLGVRLLRTWRGLLLIEVRGLQIIYESQGFAKG